MRQQQLFLSKKMMKFALFSKIEKKIFFSFTVEIQESLTRSGYNSCIVKNRIIITIKISNYTITKCISGEAVIIVTS